MPYHREQPLDNGSVSEHIFRTHKKKNQSKSCAFSSCALSSEKGGKGISIFAGWMGLWKVPLGQQMHPAGAAVVLPLLGARLGKSNVYV